MGKKRIIKKFEQLPEELLRLVKQEYPDGYEDNLITFQTLTGELANGFPLETEDTYYLIRLPKNSVASEDDDDEDGSDPPESQNLENIDSLQIADEVSEDEDD